MRSSKPPADGRAAFEASQSRLSPPKRAVSGSKSIEKHVKHNGKTRQFCRASK